jgi:hypothetical protein
MDAEPGGRATGRQIHTWRAIGAVPRSSGRQIHTWRAIGAVPRSSGRQIHTWRAIGAASNLAERETCRSEHLVPTTRETGGIATARTP